MQIELIAIVRLMAASGQVHLTTRVICEPKCRSPLFPVLPNIDFCLMRLRNSMESVKHETNQPEAKTFRRSAPNVGGGE
jgi:hypothetical protein